MRAHLSAVIALATFLAAASVNAQSAAVASAGTLAPAPTLLGTPKDGDTTVTGFFSLADQAPFRVVVIVRSGKTDVVQRTIGTEIDAEGAFTVTLKSALKAGQSVEVVGADRSLRPTTAPATADVAQAPSQEKQATLPKAAPVITAPLRAGATKVAGFLASDSVATTNRVVVLVYGHLSRDCAKDQKKTDSKGRAQSTSAKSVPDAKPVQDASAAQSPGSTEVTPPVADGGVHSCSASADGTSSAGPGGEEGEQQLVERKIAASLGEYGEFEVSLDHPLIDGDTVHAVGARATAAGGDPKSTSDNVRYTLAATTRLATATVTSTGDWGRVRAYFVAGGILSKDDQDFSKVDPTAALFVDTTWWQLNDIVRDTHTSKDESLDLLNPVMRDGHGHGKHAFRPRQVNAFFDARMTSIPTNVASTDGGTTTTDFLRSEKTALAEGGIFVPMYGDGQIWTFHGDRNAVFVGPVARLGVLTARVQPAGDAATPPDPQSPTMTDVFRFWTIGAMFGHQKLSDTPNRAPEVISFVHLSWGTWGNVRVPVFGAAPARTTPEKRWAVEGRMKIPNSIFQVGFDGNFGSRYNDLRFTFGARIDLGDVVDKLTNSGLKP